MAESNLSLTFNELMEETSFFIGYGRKKDQAAGLSATQEKDVTVQMNSGYRNFLTAFDWSFLKPVTNITVFKTATGTESGSSGKRFKASTASFYSTMVGHSVVVTSGSTYTFTEYVSTTEMAIEETYASTDDGKAFTITANGANRLPDDFGGILGDMTFQDNEGAYRGLPIRSEVYLRERLQRSTSTGRPEIAAIRPLTTDGDTGQRFDMLVWSVPDADYPVYFRYTVLPNRLTNGKYPYGGMRHGETIKAACIAAAELSRNGVKGEKWKDYAEKLQFSVRDDAKANRAESLGYMGDPFYMTNVRGRARANHVVTVGGVSYP